MVHFVFTCWKQTQDLWVPLLFVSYRYIPICHTKQYIYKTKYAPQYFRTYTNVYIRIGSTCMYKGHFIITAFNKVRAAQSVDIGLEISKMCVRILLWTRMFQFIYFCSFRRATGRSTGPIQMKSSMTFMRGKMTIDIFHEVFDIIRRVLGVKLHSIYFIKTWYRLTNDTPMDLL